MDTSTYESQQTDLQVATRIWILRGNANVFVTLTFRAETGVSFEFARKVFGTFAHMLKTELFGDRSRKRIFMVPVVEGYRKDDQPLSSSEREGTHIHCLMALPGNPLDWMDKIGKFWIESHRLCGDPAVYCPNSDDWFLELPTEEKRRVFANYVLKDCKTDTGAILWDFVWFGS